MDDEILNQYPYHCGDDEDWGGGDGGGGDDDTADQDDDADQDDADADQNDDGDRNDDADQDDADPDEANGDDGDFDSDVYQSAADFPDASEEDFEDDQGDWDDKDYAESAANIFGRNEHFGDTAFTQLADAGYNHYEDPAFDRALNDISPGVTDTMHLFERDGRLNAFGFVPMAVLQLLMARYGGLDLTGLHVAVPDRGDRVPPQPLPPEYAKVQEADAVDLRKFATPVGDQGQTSRCSAYAWTHALELADGILGKPPAKLSVNYTMLSFQKMQGDAEGYAWAYKGGDGTTGGPDPGALLAQDGTCRQELWPDDAQRPLAPDAGLARDAALHKLPGRPQPIGIDDLKKVLSAGCPVHLAMNTGSAFSEVGRDGVFNAAEPPSGQHGRHAMLITGYTGNFFTVKNSWGENWGDKGYSYVPKKVLAESDAEFVAVLLPLQPAS